MYKHIHVRSVPHVRCAAIPVALRATWFPTTPSFLAEFLCVGHGAVVGVLALTVMGTALSGVLTVVGGYLRTEPACDGPAARSA